MARTAERSIHPNTETVARTALIGHSPTKTVTKNPRGHIPTEPVARTAERRTHPNRNSGHDSREDIAQQSQWLEQLREYTSRQKQWLN